MKGFVNADELRVLDSLDRWCVKQMACLSAEMQPYLMAGGSTEDPQYRQQLGQHQAFMRMRSFISGSTPS